MTVFEFLLALYAIVAGLGVSLLVTSVGQLIEARDRVRLYWVHSCWIALTFVGHVVSWFTIWRFHEHSPWTVLQALLLLCVPILLYLISHLAVPDLEDERTTIEPAPDEAPTPIAASSSIEEQWEDGTTVAEQSTSGKRSAVVEESTIEDAARPLPPLALVPSPQPPDPAAAAKLVVIAGPDQGRVFDLRSGLEVRIGRAVDNDVVLTDIAVSRKHLALGWDGGAWVCLLYTSPSPRD